MTVDVESIAPTVLIAEARVRRTERISPAFVRVTLESPAFLDLGIEGFESLVTELDVHRAQVAFMGYWREGVAMKS